MRTWCSSIANEYYRQQGAQGRHRNISNGRPKWKGPRARRSHHRQQRRPHRHRPVAFGDLTRFSNLAREDTCRRGRNSGAQSTVLWRMTINSTILGGGISIDLDAITQLEGDQYDFGAGADRRRGQVVPMVLAQTRFAIALSGGRAVLFRCHPDEGVALRAARRAYLHSRRLSHLSATMPRTT